MTGAQSARLRATGVDKSFGATHALTDVDLVLASGRVHALVGENGAGKSTLVGILSGVTSPDAGVIELDGEAYRPRTVRDARERGVVLVHQELALAPHRSVAENVFLGMEPTRWGRLDRDAMRRGTASALAELRHPEISPDAPVGSLSVAERQIVEIARALVLEARVLILDEPTSSLSRPDVEILFALLGRLRAKGLAIVYISHFLEEVFRVADDFTVLRDGRVVAAGGITERTIDEVVGFMVGTSMGELFPRSERRRGELVLELSELWGRDKPRGASLSLHRGEVFGIAGLIGAGRTELVRAVFGLDEVERGAVRVGAFSGPARPADWLEHGMGLLSEDRQGEGVLLDRTITENITLSRLDRWLRPRRLASASRELVDELGIVCRSTEQRLSTLSGGNQQKVAFARLLHHDLEVLLLDEPTRGIDVASKALIYRWIDRLAHEGKAVLLVSSDLQELLGLSDRVGVMRRGELGEPRPAEELDEARLLREAVS